MGNVRFKLFVMMVLEFFIWGAWFPLIFGYLPSLGLSAGQQSWILNAFPIAAIVGMFFSNQYADRHFAAERFLAFSHAVAGIAILGLAFIQAPTPEQVFNGLDRNGDGSIDSTEYQQWAQTVPSLKDKPAQSDEFFKKLDANADGRVTVEDFKAVPEALAGLPVPNAPFWPFFGLMLIHCLLYVPTISITNSIAFANMTDPKDFGIVRMGGTIGWILAAWPFTFILVDWQKVNASNPEGFVKWFETVLGSGLAGQALQEGTRWTYIVAGIASLVLAAFSLALPHTPPKKVEQGAEALAWLEAMKLLKHPFVLVLWLVTFVDAFVHNSYFNWTGVFLGTKASAGGVGVPGNWIMPIMSVGQIAEILTMAVLGWTLKRLGWRITMVLGILGHAARFGVYAYFPQNKELIILVQVLHGICYAFFFATVYIFVDEYFPKDARASAQGLFNLMILGIGSLVANSICPKLIQEVYTKTQEDGTKVTDFHGLFLVPLFCAIAAAVALAVFFNPPKKEEASVA